MLQSFCARCAALVLALACTSFAHAATIDFDLNFNFGTVDTQGDVLVSISDNGDGTVTIGVTNHTAGFINDLFLNYGGSLAGASITTFAGAGVTQPTIGFNALQGFAIDFGYQTANNDPGRFDPNESVSFVLDAASDLSAALFDTLGGNPTGENYYAAAHINAIPASGNCADGSGKTGDTNGANVTGGGGALDGVCTSVQQTPEPGSLMLVSLALCAVAAVLRAGRAKV